MPTRPRSLGPIAVVVALLAAAVAPISTPALAATPTSDAPITVPSAARIGSNVPIAVTASACAGKPISPALSVIGLRGMTRSVTAPQRTADANGTASWRIAIPASVAKSAESRRAYWTASSSDAGCAGALQKVAAATVLTAATTASVRVSAMTATTVVVAASGCTGGIAQAFFATTGGRRTPAATLPSGSSFRATLVLPAGAKALFLDCVAARVPSFTGSGLAVTAGVVPAIVNSPPVWPDEPESSIAVDASAVCTGGGAAGRWPVICAAPGIPLSLSGPDGLQSLPDAWREQESTIGTTAFLADFAPTDAQWAASTPTHATTSGERAAVAQAAPGSTTTTSNKDGTVTTSTLSTTTTDTVTEAVSNSEVAVGPAALDALRQHGTDLRSLSVDLTQDLKQTNQYCPAVDGSVSDLTNSSLALTLHEVDHFGRHIDVTVSWSGSVGVVYAVDDSAAFTKYTVTATETEHYDQSAHPVIHETANASYSHSFPVTTPDAIAMEQQLADAGTSSIRGTGSPDLQNGVGAVIGGNLVLGVSSASAAGTVAFRHFNTEAKCLILKADGSTQASPSASTTLALTVSDEDGGAVSVPATLKASPGTVQPTSATLTDSGATDVQYTAPAATDDTTALLSATGLSNRGRLNGTVDISLSPQTGAITLGYSATVSLPDDQCSVDTPIGTYERCEYIPDDAIDGNDSYSGSFASTLSASVPIEGTTDLSKSSGTGSAELDETVQTLTSNGTFSNGFIDIGCTQSGTEAFTPNGTQSGSMTVSALTDSVSSSGTPTDLNLQLSADLGGLFELYSDHVVFTASSPADDCPAVGSYDQDGNIDTGGSLIGDANAPLLGEDLDPVWTLTGWTMNPSWSPTKGGVLGTKTLTTTVPLSAPDTGTATVSQTFTVSTAPAAAAATVRSAAR